MFKKRSPHRNFIEEFREDDKLIFLTGKVMGKEEVFDFMSLNPPSSSVSFSILSYEFISKCLQLKEIPDDLEEFSMKREVVEVEEEKGGEEEEDGREMKKKQRTNSQNQQLHHSPSFPSLLSTPLSSSHPQLFSFSSSPCSGGWVEVKLNAEHLMNEAHEMRYWRKEDGESLKGNCEKIVAFDMDFTLIKPSSGAKFPATFDDMELLYEEEIPRVMVEWMDKGFQFLRRD